MTKKNHYRQRIPNYIDLGIPPPGFDFDTTEELINHPELQRNMEMIPNTELYLHNEPYISEGLLMMVYNEGLTWCCVGYIKNPEDVNLPAWSGCKYVAQYDDGTIEILDNTSKNPVVSSCGGKLTLKDGTKCKRLEYEDWKKLEVDS
jgi:hypothetical protein